MTFMMFVALMFPFVSTTYKRSQPSYIISSQAKELPSGPGTEYMYSSMIVEENSRRYAYYCCDKQEERIFDHICLRVGVEKFYSTKKTKEKNKVWVYGEEITILNPHDYGMRHFCDPNVITGSFVYQNVSYSHILFFTYAINDMDKGINNRVGVAYSNSFENSWKMRPGPLLDLKVEGKWGVGQPSAVSHGARNVSLFYTRGDACTAFYRQVFDLSDVGKVKKIGEELQVSLEGLYKTDKSQETWLNNAAICFDTVNQVYLLIREGHPYPLDIPQWISSNVQIAFTNDWIRWKVLNNVKMEGLDRSHNSRWIVSGKGLRLHSDQLEYTVSVSNSGEGSLWTYRVCSVVQTLEKDFDYEHFTPSFVPVNNISLVEVM